MTTGKTPNQSKKVSSDAHNNEWNSVKLGAITKWTSGKQRPKEINAGKTASTPYAVFGGNGVIGFCSSYNVVAPNITIGRVGEYCGVIHRVSEKSWVTDNALYLKWMDENVDVEFLTTFLEHLNLAKYRSKGGQPLITQGAIEDVDFTIPSLLEQRKIAAILSTWDRALQKTEVLIETKRRLKSDLMYDLLTARRRFNGQVVQEQTGIGRLPKSWKRIPFRETLAGRPAYGANASAVEFEPETTYRYVRITDIDDDGRLIEANRMGILKNEADGCLLQKGDILIARTGNTVGKSFLYLEDEPMAFAGYLIRFKLNEKIAVIGYVRAFLHSKIFWNWVKNTIKVGAQPNINSEEYQSLPIPLPSLSEQKRIADCLGALDREIALLEGKAVKFREQKKGLMQKLLTGSLRVKV